MAKRPTKWTYEALAASAASYDNVRAWRTEEPSAYATASQQGLLEELTKKMHRERVPQGFWTKSQVLKSAKKYKTKIKWLENEPTAYSKAHKYGWISEATAHMGVVGNKYSRLVYVIKVEKLNVAYIGLTGNPKRRFRDHLKTKRFRELIDRVGLKSVVFEELTDYLSPKYASESEAEWLKRYSNKGYKILNKVKAGGLGGKDLRWTNEAILEDAKKYESVMDWINSPGGAYGTASRKGLIEKATAHMKRQIRTPGTWTLKEVIERANSFNSTSEWRRKDSSSYNAAKNHGWYHLSEVSGNLQRRVQLNKRWTSDKVLADAKSFQTIGGWTKASGGAVSAAKKMGLWQQATAHMEKPKNVLKWNREAVLLDARKYTSRSEWKKHSGGAYSSATRNGWYDEAVSHMKLRNPIGKWTHETVIAEALKYQSKSDWQAKSAGSYEAAKRLRCFVEATSHMVVQRKKWTQAEVIDAAKSFPSIKEWRAKHAISYAAAHRLGIISEVSKHMARINPIGIWLEKEAVLADAKKYLTRSEWHKKSAGAYTSAKRNGWFEEAVSHMLSSNHR